MIFFQRGGGVKMVLEILQEWGRVIFLLKKWKITERWGGGGFLSEIPSVVGVWILSGTTHFKSNLRCALVRL